MIQQLINTVLHIDSYLAHYLMLYGAWVYFVLFAIIFFETGCVLTAFLPGDSLLFIAGALAAVNHSALNVIVLFFLLALASLLGNQFNYYIGQMFRAKLLRSSVFYIERWLKPHYLEAAHQFYERHGAIAIILARFIPIIRTFVPFVAGMSAMHHKKFLLYNIISGIAWVGSLLILGYFLGNIPFVQQNLTWVIYGIIAISLSLPVLTAAYHHYYG